MNLNQTKLTKLEWQALETPVSAEELDILKLIQAGYDNVNIKVNQTPSLISFLKIESTSGMEDYLWARYYTVNGANIKHKIGKADEIRMQKNTVEIVRSHPEIYENQLDAAINIKNKEHAYYAVASLLRLCVDKPNRHAVAAAQAFLEQNAVSPVDLALKLPEFALGPKDLCLYDHQKEIFTAIKRSTCPQLILYIAPTGTGKTLTPIGLCQSKRVIFVCAARHVGLALAKSAISVGKKVAFAFGCETASDIRLHNSAAKEFTKNFRTGGIYRIDNSVGDNVELMICDVGSYLVAMLYMIAFNPVENLVLYWDEPTLTMDYESHELHEMIGRNWRENKVPIVVLSSATLPKLREIRATVGDFAAKFVGAQVTEIVSHDSTKSIPIVNKQGFAVLPHTFASNWVELQAVVEHCKGYLTLLRYFDLEEIVAFLQANPSDCLERHIGEFADVTATNVKLAYLDYLSKISAEEWPGIAAAAHLKRKRRVPINPYVDTAGNKVLLKATSVQQAPTQGGDLVRANTMPIAHTAAAAAGAEDAGTYITTKDAFTLTDGPSIFLAADVEKVANVYLAQAGIPARVMDDINEKIQFNDALQAKTAILEKKLEDMEQAKASAPTDNKKQSKKASEQVVDNKETRRLVAEIDAMRSLTKVARLNDTFVPNSVAHLARWAERAQAESGLKPYCSDIDDVTVQAVMRLNVSSSFRILLLMGVGVFIKHECIEYGEIMKRLADEKRLYLIIASSDYIYGTSYSFSNGYIGKDMCGSQEKIIQSAGRVGRFVGSEQYTVRFRDDADIRRLLTHDDDKPEVRNMNQLFCAAPAAV